MVPAGDDLGGNTPLPDNVQKLGKYLGLTIDIGASVITKVDLLFTNLRGVGKCTVQRVMGDGHELIKSVDGGWYQPS